MSHSITIYYGTMTGNAEALARRAETRALNRGWHARLLNLSEVKPAELCSGGYALFIVSTWGDGEPPADATDFWYDLEKSTLDLTRLRYAVFGLGDTDYQEFNAFARKLDERLGQLGGHRVFERIEADLQYEETYEHWEARIFPLVGEGLTSSPQL